MSNQDVATALATLSKAGTDPSHLAGVFASLAHHLGVPGAAPPAAVAAPKPVNTATFPAAISTAPPMSLLALQRSSLSKATPRIPARLPAKAGSKVTIRKSEPDADAESDAPDVFAYSCARCVRHL